MNTAVVRTIGLLILSNAFMTFAWYAHLKNLRDKPWLIAALVSWGIALVEYLFQVPANRIGYNGGMTLSQLKILQEVITLTLFVPFVIFYMQQSLSWNYLWAGLCLLGAVYFMFKDPVRPTAADPAKAGIGHVDGAGQSREISDAQR